MSTAADAHNVSKQEVCLFEGHALRIFTERQPELKYIVSGFKDKTVQILLLSSIPNFLVCRQHWGLFSSLLHEIPTYEYRSSSE